MTTQMRLADSTRAFALAAMLIGAAAGIGALAPQTAKAQVKDASEVKSIFKPALPAGALEVSAAMKSAKVGDTIIVRGNVAMSNDAFVESVASFTLVDESLRNGTRPPADQLADTSSDIPVQGRATVHILDTAGKPLRANLNGQHGLKPGAEVFVTGTVESANGTDTLVLSVVSMHVPKAPLPIGFFVAAQPENAKDVSTARKEGGMKVGDAVVLRGRVGGSKEPFVPGRAVFTLMGRGLKACNENPDDKCSVPWDYCCETKSDILANSVTVQVLDAKGQILRTDMKGRHNLKELSEVIVVGKVASADGKAVVVNATSAFVAP